MNVDLSAGIHVRRADQNKHTPIADMGRNSYNNDQNTWMSPYNSAAYSETPKLEPDLSPLSTFSEPTSPTQRIALQALSLSSPRSHRPKITDGLNPIRLMDWGPSSGSVGTKIIVKLALIQVDPNYPIRARVVLESKLTREIIWIAAHLIYEPFDSNSTQRTASVTSVIPEIHFGKASDSCLNFQPFSVKICLDLHQSTNIFRQTIPLGDYVHLTTQLAQSSKNDQAHQTQLATHGFPTNHPLVHLAPSLDSDSRPTESFSASLFPTSDSSFATDSSAFKPLLKPSSLGVQASTSALKSSSTHETGTSNRLWGLKSSGEYGGPPQFELDAASLAEPKSEEETERFMPFPFNPIYPAAHVNPDSRSNQLTLMGPARPGHSGRSKSQSDSRTTRTTPDIAAPQSHPQPRLESRLIFRLDGMLSEMMCGWTSAEMRWGRRLVQFSRTLQGSTMSVFFQAVPSHISEPDNRTGVVSCIYRDETDSCYITSVDTISLIESLVGTSFPTAEKNRIRRNLQGFKPLTVTKSKPDSEAFFKRIMSFQNPKPRNIEKDIKVFSWSTLESALTKVLGKYTCLSHGPHDSGTTICFDFKSHLRDSSHYRTEAILGHSPSTPVYDTMIHELDGGPSHSGRPFRSLSSGALDYSSMTSSQSSWLEGLRNEEPSAMSFVGSEMNMKPLDFLCPLPWRLPNGLDSPNSSASFETPTSATTMNDGRGSHAPVLASILGHSFDHHHHRQDLNPFEHVPNRKQEVMIHDGVHERGTSGTA